MNHYILQRIHPQVITKEDHIKSIELQAKVDALEKQRQQFNIYGLEAAIDEARARYIAAPTAENLQAFEEARIARIDRSKHTGQLTASIDEAEAELMRKEIIPWQESVLDRLIPEAKKVCEELVQEERERHLAVLCSDCGGSGPITQAALATAHGVTAMRSSLAQVRRSPYDFMMALRVGYYGTAEAVERNFRPAAPVKPARRERATA